MFVVSMIMGVCVNAKINTVVDVMCRRYYATLDPLLPFLGDDELPGRECNNASVQALAARLTTTVNLLAGLLASVSTAIYGSLSDRYGRRLILIAASLGTTLTDLCYILTLIYADRVGSRLLLLSGITDGVGGSFPAMAAGCAGYVTDCSTGANRAERLSIFVGCFYLGLMLGPAIGGYAATYLGGYITVFSISFVAHVLFVLYVALVLPESLSLARRKQAQARHEGESRNVSHSRRLSNQMDFRHRYRTLFYDARQRAASRNIVILMCMEIILSLQAGIAAFEILYAKYRFQWRDIEQGLFVTFIGGTRVLALFVVLPILTRLFRRYHQPRILQQQHEAEGARADELLDGATRFETYAVRISLLLQTIGFFLMARANTSAMFFISSIAASVAAMGAPNLQSALTKHVHKHKIGALIGMQSQFQSISRIAAPLVFGSLYSRTVSTQPELFLYVLCFILGIAFLSSLWIRPHGKLSMFRSY